MTRNNDSTKPDKAQHHRWAANRQARKMASTSRPKQTAKAWAAHVIAMLRGGRNG